jgi:hypothetical protein
MNDDLRRDPYNDEMRFIAEPFGQLLKEIVITIDKYGLRRRYLSKFVKPAEKLCAAIVGGQFTSPTATKYQQRFENTEIRYSHFLRYDALPWNNNNGTRRPLFCKIAALCGWDFYRRVHSSSF